MDQDVTLAEPTSSAATRQTEPEVVAGIASGDIPPGVPTDIRSGGPARWSLGSVALILVGGAAVGYGLNRWLRS